MAALRKCCQDVLQCETSTSQARAYLPAKLFKALLLRQKNETIPQAQNRKGRAIP